MQERYSNILEQWFIMEPPLFQVLCVHELVANTQMKCPLRSGRRKLEYNPEIVVEMSDEALEEAVLPLIPMGRLISPEDIAEAILFLSSEQARMITGQVIKVSGGKAL